MMYALLVATLLLLRWRIATGSEDSLEAEEGLGALKAMARDEGLQKSVPHTLDMVSLNVQIYEPDKKVKAGDEVIADTTGNMWKVTYIAQDRLINEKREGKIWLAEFVAGKACALVARGTANFKSLWRDDLKWSTVPIPETDYTASEGFQRHANDIMKNDNNWLKVSSWLKSCKDRGFKKIFSGHSLGGSVATWLAIRFEAQSIQAFQPDYVVTFGQPRLVGSFGPDRCPASLQSREKAVRIVSMTGANVDAATLVPPSRDRNESFCFEALSLDKTGNLIHRDHQWPLRRYLPITQFLWNQVFGGWSLHSSSNKYTDWLLRVRNRAEDNDCKKAGERCDGSQTGDCGRCCSKEYGYVWYKLRYQCK